MVSSRSVVTAGAYVWSGNLLPFIVGPNRAGDRLAVVRLGGHREGDESAWQCAAREVQEETSITISPLQPPTTYWLRSGEAATCIRVCPWPADSPTEVAPVLVVENDRPPVSTFSVMYLARSPQSPVPSGETQGLLLLRPRDVQHIVAAGLTLQDYLGMGGQAMLRKPFSSALPLEPFLQLRVLAELLRRHPDLPIDHHPIDPP